MIHIVLTNRHAPTKKITHINDVKRVRRGRLNATHLPEVNIRPHVQMSTTLNAIAYQV